MPKGIYLTEELIKSPAYREIGTPADARLVLALFYLRRRIKKIEVIDKETGHKFLKPEVVNNGQIVFTYREAKEKYGIPQTTFSRCLDKLVEVGFLDVAEAPDRINGTPTKWYISDRWRYYGTEWFQKVEHQKTIPAFDLRKKKKTPPHYQNW
jgi:hypothetical protein